MARLNVTFDDATAHEPDRLVPPRRRSRFVVDAVREKMARVRQVAAVNAAAGAWDDDGRGDATAEIRELRASWRPAPGARKGPPHG